MTAPRDPYAASGASSTGSGGRPSWRDEPGQGSYGQPEASRPRSNGVGTAALVVGILAVLTCWTLLGGIVLGIVAIVLGARGRARAKRGEADNGGSALAGLVLGIAGLALSLLLLAVGASIFNALFNTPEGDQLRECISNAQGDRAAADRCADQFNQSQ